MYDNWYWIEKEDGVRFCIGNRGKCINIEVPNDIKTLILNNFASHFIDIHHISKSFPNVTSIVIGEDVFGIEIPNSLFPNVRNVVSHSEFFVSGTTLQYKEDEYCKPYLKNSFCLREDEVLDLKGVCLIEGFALDGCMTTNFINTNMVTRLAECSFYGSKFDELRAPQKGVLMAGSIMVAIDDTADEIEIPKETTAINFARIDFMGLNCVKAHKLSIIETIGRFGTPHKIVLSKNTTYDHIDFSLGPFELLKEFEVDIDNPDFKSIDGILYTKDGKTLIKCPTMKTGDITVPEGVDTIKANAFYSSHIESLKLPDSLKDIETQAFAFCRHLKNIDFGNGIAKIEGDFAFLECTSLSRLSLPDQVKSIGYGAFSRSGIESINFSDRINDIQANAFYDCVKLKKIYLPSHAVRLGKHAFSSVTEVDVTEGGYLPYGLNEAVADSATVGDDSIVKIRQGNQFVYLTKDLISRKTQPFSTIKSMQEVYSQHKMKVLAVMLASNMESEFSEAINVSDCNKEELESLLREAGNKKSTIATAYVLNLIHEKSQVDLSI